LLDRKLITTAGRKQVIGRPILYKTTKEFLMRFGLKDVNELPSMEEFEKLVAASFQGELIPAEDAAQTTESVEAEEIAESAAQKE
jgi:segregation and condensation protein B